MRFEVITAENTTVSIFWVVSLYVDTNISEEHTASVFRKALMMKAVCLSQTVVSTYEFTRRYSREDKHRRHYPIILLLF
jgi:hypothetical protein